jgi:hypothetical protein
MAHGKRASNDLSAPDPAFVHHSSSAFMDPRRSGPIMNLGFGDKQRPSSGLRCSSQLVKNTRPKLWHEGTFVNAVNQLQIHRFFFHVQRPMSAPALNRHPQCSGVRRLTLIARPSWQAEPQLPGNPSAHVARQFSLRRQCYCDRKRLKLTGISQMGTASSPTLPPFGLTGKAKPLLSLK